MKFCNRYCFGGNKADILISETANNLDRLFFRCRLRNCNFFEWWRLEDENQLLSEDDGAITSRLNMNEQSSSNFGDEDVGVTRFLHEEDSNSYNSLKNYVMILTFFVLLLTITLFLR